MWFMNIVFLELVSNLEESRRKRSLGMVFFEFDPVLLVDAFEWIRLKNILCICL